MPFGLNIASRIFTNAVKNAVKPPLDEGITILYYLDDGVVAAPIFEEYIQHTKRVVLDITKLGFHINITKIRSDAIQEDGVARTDMGHKR